MKDNPERPYTSPIAHVRYWWPTIQTGIFCIITFGCLSYRRNAVGSENDANSEQQEHAFHTSTILLSTILLNSAVCNAAFGRKPNNDGHHNPVTHQITQAVGGALPTMLAIGANVGSLAARTVLGDRATAANHIASEILGATDMLNRVNVIQDRLYDHAMDRSPAIPRDGNMRRLEYFAMRAENLVTSVIEAAAHVGFLAMNAGVTRFTINDNNRLYVIAGIYEASDIVENYIITYINENVYYLERIADMRLMSSLLRGVSIADPTHPIHVVDVRTTTAISDNLNDAVADIGENLHDAINAVEEEVMEAVHGLVDDLSFFTRICHAFSCTSSVAVRENTAATVVYQLTHDEDGSWLVTSNGNRYSAHIRHTTVEDIMHHNHGTGLIARYTEHHRDLGHGLHSHHDNGHVVIIIDDVRIEFSKHKNASSTRSNTGISTTTKPVNSNVLEVNNNSDDSREVATGTLDDTEAIQVTRNDDSSSVINLAENRHAIHIRSITARDLMHHHGIGLFARYSEHHRDLGHGLHSHHENGHVVIIMGDIRIEFLENNEHQS